MFSAGRTHLNTHQPLKEEERMHNMCMHAHAYKGRKIVGSTAGTQYKTVVIKVHDLWTSLFSFYDITLGYERLR